MTSQPELTQPDGPGPRSRLQLMAAQLKLFMDPFGTVGQRFAQYGEAYCVDQGKNALYVFRHPDHIRDVLVTQAGAFDKQHPGFRRLSLVLGDAMLTSDGERWRRQRRLVQPAFARPRLVQYSAQMVEQAARLRSELKPGQVLDVGRAMNALTLRIVTRTLFGQALDENGQTAAAVRALNRMFTLPPAVLRLVPGAQRRFDGTVATLDSVMAQVIDRKQPQLAEAARVGASDLLAALMLAEDEDGERLSRQELRDQLLTLYLAGHETTSHALTWTLYLLSQNPEARAKLRLELRSVLGDRLPSFEDLAALPYTEQVIKEAMRLYPPAFVLPRHVNRDVQVGSYQLPKDSEVVIWTFHTHRDPRWYPQPERFVPERFEAARESERPKYAYLPFGAGQRACIGQMFAMIEAQLILATLLSQFDFRYQRRKPPGLRSGLTLAPAGGMPMQVQSLQ